MVKSVEFQDSLLSACLSSKRSRAISYSYVAYTSLRELGAYSSYRGVGEHLGDFRHIEANHSSVLEPCLRRTSLVRRQFPRSNSHSQQYSGTILLKFFMVTRYSDHVSARLYNSHGQVNLCRDPGHPNIPRHYP